MARTIRAPWWSLLPCSLGVLGFAGFVGIEGVVAGGVFVVLGPLAGVLLLGLGVRMWQLRVVVADDVIVVNWLRTHRVVWSELERFMVYDKGVWVRYRAWDKSDLRFDALSGGPQTLQFAMRPVERAASQLEDIRFERSLRQDERDRPSA